ncbi:MAG: hypothetical protein LBJ47_01165, partial [Tannerella sp.]|nr:hypothetical protein [Tannerella sp.]
HPKNPAIASVFRELEWGEDLGSGVRNMFHYLPLYVKDKSVTPIMEDGDVFRLTIRYERERAYPVEKSSNHTTIKHADKILEMIGYNSKITAIAIGNELSLSESHVRKILSRLVKSKVIEHTGSDKGGEWLIMISD